jgi:hypothetical protein
LGIGAGAGSKFIYSGLWVGAVVVVVSCFLLALAPVFPYIDSLSCLRLSTVVLLALVASPSGPSFCHHLRKTHQALMIMAIFLSSYLNQLYHWSFRLHIYISRTFWTTSSREFCRRHDACSAYMTLACISACRA